MKTLLISAAAFTGILFLSGCSGSNELSKNEDEILRNNMSRPLNANELSQMGKSETGAKSAGRPARTKG